MFFSADVVSLVLYCAQQLGVTLGVGAQTIMLVAYLSAMRDGIVDAKEAQFARAVRQVLNTGLVLIILSGVGITALHLMAGEAATVISAAYLFKWVLVLGVLACTLLKSFSQKIMQGLAGGSWYALFVVHILAPVASWANLLTLYAVWMIGFGICWATLVFITQDKKGTITIKTPPVFIPPKPAPVVPKPIPPPPPKPIPPPPPKLIPPPPPPPKIIPPPPPKPVAPPPPLPPKPAPPPPANLPVLPPQPHIVQTLPQPEVAKKPAPKVLDEQNPWLPAIQIMPKTQVDANKQTIQKQDPATPPPK